jgi:putative endonuclease
MGRIMIYTVYVLYSKKYDKIYIGYTSDLIKRFYSHNELGIKGFTVKYRSWEVAYTEVFTDKNEAKRREKELKSSRGRAFIREQIVGLISVS